MTNDPPSRVVPPCHDFSLVLGGPLYQLMRRAHLSGDVLEMVLRRIVALSGFTWLPLLILSIAEGRAWGHSVKVPFLMDIDVHARLLLALPLLIAAELFVHQRMRPVVERFVERGLVPDERRGQFDAAIASAMRLRNSVVAEVLLILLVYGCGVLVVWRIRGVIEVPTWFGETVEGNLRLTWAGGWFAFVSLPAVQFILIRWYFRLFIWGRFLWQVSRLDLRLVPTHPDRSGGLGFLSGMAYCFEPLLAGQGVLLAGVMANKIFYTGAKLPQFKMELIGFVAVMLLFVLSPLLVFMPLLARTKRIGVAEYGAFAQRYVREFDDKWLRGGAAAGTSLVGSADLQSLADLSNAYDVVRGMRWVPVSKQMVLQLAMISLVPVAPLILTMIPFGDLLDRLFKVVL